MLGRIASGDPGRRWSRRTRTWTADHSAIILHGASSPACSSAPHPGRVTWPWHKPRRKHRIRRRNRSRPPVPRPATSPRPGPPPMPGRRNPSPRPGPRSPARAQRGLQGIVAQDPGKAPATPRPARQGQALDDVRPIGAIVPWPMPPALIIRQTPEVHGEVNSLLGQLRKLTQ